MRKRESTTMVVAVLRRSLTLSIAVMLTAATSVDAQGQRGIEPALDPSVTWVATGARRETSEKKGVLRVVVMRGGGFEGDRLYVQWVDTTSGAASVAHTVSSEKFPPDAWALSDPRFEQVTTSTGVQWRATIEGEHKMTANRVRNRWILTFGKPGGRASRKLGHSPLGK
jgi:hypothetical protein